MVFVALTLVNLISSSELLVNLKQGVFYFILFIANYGIQIAIDGGGQKHLTAELLGSTSGLIFFWSFGLLIQFNLSSLAHSLVYRPMVYSFFSMLYVSCVIIWCFWALDSHYQDVRPDVFLVKADFGAYQRPGNFLIIQNLICCALL